MQILYYSKDFIQNHIPTIKTKGIIRGKTGLHLGFIKFKGEVNLTYEKLTPLFSHLEYCNCYPHNGLLKKSETGDRYLIKMQVAGRETDIHLHNDCVKELGIINGDIDVRFYAFNAKSPEQIDKKDFNPIVIIGIDKQSSIVLDIEEDTIPIGIKGLEEILFPECSGRKNIGFKRPTKDNTVPRVILIKGAPGTGKTVLAIKMMLHMLQNKCWIRYFCLNDTAASVYSQADSFWPDNKVREFEPFSFQIIDNISTEDMAKKAQKIAHKANEKGILASIKNIIALFTNTHSDSYTKVIFFDSFNIPLFAQTDHGSDVRSFIRRLKIDDDGKNIPLLSFILLEDYGQNCDDKTKQLISDCEFLSDIVIELGEELRQGYLTHYIKINKKHFGPQIYGKHLLQIAPKKNPFSIIENETGSVIYPSIHKYLSRSLEDTFSRNNFVHTGISHLDSMLKSTRESGNVDGKSIPQNSCFVIKGNEGGYDLTIGINLLLGGLWEVHESVVHGEIKPTVQAGKDVLLISLNEENNVEIFNEAIALRTDQFASKFFRINLDNGNWIDWRYHNATVAKDIFTPILKECGDVYLTGGQKNKNINSIRRFYSLRDTNISQAEIDLFISDFTALSDDSKKKFLISSSDDVWQILMMDPKKDLYDIENKLQPIENESNFIDDHGNVTRIISNTTKLDLFNDAHFENRVLQILYRTHTGDDHYQLDKSGNPECKCSVFFKDDANINKKVIFNKWCAYLLDDNGDRQGTCRKMVIASFRPGCITPEQFVYCVEKILEKGSFSRILFNSTANLGMRFPLLYNYELFIPSLVDLFKSKNVMSIFIDPCGDGSHQLLTYTLVNLADYIITLKDFKMESGDFDTAHKHFDFPSPKKIKRDPIWPDPKGNDQTAKNLLNDLVTNIDVCRWSEMVVENIRGNNYSRIPHAITARYRSIKVPIDKDTLKQTLSITDSEYMDKTWKLLIGLNLIVPDPKEETRQSALVDSFNISVRDLKGIILNKQPDLSDKIGPLVNILRRYRPRNMNELFIVNIKKFKRAVERYMTTQPIVATFGSGQQAFVVKDISENGMCVEAHTPLMIPQYQKTLITFSTNDNNQSTTNVVAECLPVVRWIHFVEESNKYNLGVNFEQLSPEDKEKFKQEIEKFTKQKAS